MSSQIKTVVAREALFHYRQAMTVSTRTRKPIFLQIEHKTDDGRVFIDMPDDGPCTSCGACCSHFRISFIAMEMDCSPGGTVPSDLVSQINPVMGCMKGTEKGHGRCIALRGEIGRPGIGCAIYAGRPSPCREYPVWLPDGQANPDCQRLRAAAGLPPLAARPQ